MVKARARVEARVGETVRVTVRAWQQGYLGVRRPTEARHRCEAQHGSEARQAGERLDSAAFWATESTHGLWLRRLMRSRGQPKREHVEPGVPRAPLTEVCKGREARAQIGAQTDR